MINYARTQMLFGFVSNEELSKKFKQYHLGCGPILADGFLNIDGDLKRFSQNIKSGIPYMIEGKPTTFILQHDLRNGIPAVSNSLHVIYHSHFFEHLSEQEGLVFLSECYRCLMPGGLMRFAVPDFNLWCNNYISNNVDFFDWYRKTYLGDNRSRYKTKASVFMGMLYNWGHKMSYDFETLSTLLNDAGFTHAQRIEWGKSDTISNIESIEDLNPRRFESLVIECLKDSA